jgi:hypothetical protein
MVDQHIEPELNALRELYGAVPSAEELDAALNRSNTTPIAARRQSASSPRSRRILVMSTFAILILVAGASATTVLWPEPIKVTDGVSKFDEPSPTPVSANEYERLTEYNLVPNTTRIGELRPDEMKPLLDLAPIDEARVIVDDPLVGRLIAVPARDDSAVCYLYSSPGSLQERKQAGGCGLEAFPPSGVEAIVQESGSTQEVMGFAADDVESVIVELADGTTDTATMRENAFYWKSDGIKAVGLRSKRTGTSSTDTDDIQP